MHEEIVRFLNRRRMLIAGTLLTPDAHGPRPAVLLIHGLGGNRNEPHNIAISEGIAQKGIVTLRIDLTNNRGESDGAFEDMTLTGEVGDAEDALRYLLRRPGVDATRVGVAGHSFGGLVSALLAAREPRIRAVAPLSPVFDMRQRLRDSLGEEGLTRWRETGYRHLDAELRQGYGFWEDLEGWEIVQEVRRITAPILVMLGRPNDVPIANGQAYMEHVASAEKHLEIVEGADHVYSNDTHLRFVVDTVAGWFARQLGTF